ncbi:DUF1700 domain-containing protein [Tissierella sp. Yu-01]|uniref:DUF1700 domain-containing protein n=1 Tax=Tissierella sp. Yu-01 TaxID=3035694 RepID=UPI00240DF27F|nr:DUF1700 domain-containing protein [Tissierella sp. Yu-01]WFA10232.1 DUF1700 domain-containing protein [Tissierella sp. Yu-01]
MTRVEYINRLKTNLQGLPIDEITDILSDYEEHFNIGISKGKSEEEISKELGDPREVAEGYRSNFRSNPKEPRPSTTNDNTRKFLFGLLLVGVNVVVLFVPAMTLFGLLMGLFGVGIGFTFGGFGIMLGFPVKAFLGMTAPHFLTSFGIGLGLSSMGLLILILGFHIVKILFKLIVIYFRWNVDLMNK